MIDIFQSRPSRKRQRVTRVAIVGLGPWGLANLERLVAVARYEDDRVVIHVIEPERPGAGVFSVDTPDFLPLNTPCGQHVIHPTGDGDGELPYTQSLYSWAVEQGYRWIGDQCRVSNFGRAISPHDFLPRRLMGEWLHWSYLRILESCPTNVSVFHHPTYAVDIEATDEIEIIRLGDGRSLSVDHVILATGNTSAEPDAAAGGRWLPPYPVEQLDRSILAGDHVAISGLGLVAMDVVTTLTVGRGGRFREAEHGLEYVPCGREPAIYLFSRSGRPYWSKAIGASDPTGEYQPVICTPPVAAGLRGRSGETPARGSLDFGRDVLPLLTAEMQVRYYRQCALIEGSLDDAEKLSTDLACAWAEGRFDEAIGTYTDRYGAFDPQKHLFGAETAQQYRSSGDYQMNIYAEMKDDVAESLRKPLTSPIKAAYETLRILRDWMRDVLEFQGLVLESYLDFQNSTANRIKAAVAGPPVRRTQEILALIDAGIVQLPFGPGPNVEPTPKDTFVIRSTSLIQPFCQEVHHLVQGYLKDPTIVRTRSPLLRRLVSRGRMVPLRYGDVSVGSVDLTVDSHPIGQNMEVQERLWMAGGVTEGIRYFTHYVPSPKSRVRAFLDAEACARKILAAELPSQIEHADQMELNVTEAAV